MNRFVALGAGVSMLMVQPASAQTFTPSGIYEFNGTVQFSQNTTVICVFKIVLSVPTTPSSTATATPSFVFPGGNPLCYGAQFSGTPYAVSFDPPTSKLSLHGVVITQLPTSCSGTLTGTWDNVGKKLIFDTALPGAGGAMNCTVKAVMAGPAGLSIS